MNEFQETTSAAITMANAKEGFASGQEQAKKLILANDYMLKYHETDDCVKTPKKANAHCENWLNEAEKLKKQATESMKMPKKEECAG